MYIYIYTYIYMYVCMYAYCQMYVFTLLRIYKGRAEHYLTAVVVVAVVAAAVFVGCCCLADIHTSIQLVTTATTRHYPSQRACPRRHRHHRQHEAVQSVCSLR